MTQRHFPSAESCSVSAPSDYRFDAAAPWLAPVSVVVIAPVGGDPVGSLAWAADLASNGHDAFDEREQLSDVVAVPARQRDRQRQPGGVHQQVVLGAGASAVNRRRPGQATLEERGCGLSLRPPRPVDPASGVRAAKKFAVQSLPHPCALPLPKPPPSAHPRTQPICHRTIVTAPRHQHEHDRREDCSVTSSGAPCPLRGAIRQQRLHQLPQPIIDELRSRHGPPPG